MEDTLLLNGGERAASGDSSSIKEIISGQTAGNNKEAITHGTISS